MYNILEILIKTSIAFNMIIISIRLFNGIYNKKCLGIKGLIVDIIMGNTLWILYSVGTIWMIIDGDDILGFKIKKIVG